MLFSSDCGATTGFSVQVSILAPGRIPRGAGNTFVADGDPGAALPGRWGGPWAEMRWTGPRQLQIAYASGARVFERKGQVAGVTVSYQSASRRAPSI